MARNDGIDRTVARNQDLETPADVAKVQEHNEREKDSYSNQDIVPERTALNVHFKSPTDDYVKMFEQMEQDGVISTRGLKPDAVKYGELIFDVNSAYFYNHGGYEFAKQFYADAYKAAVEIVDTFFSRDLPYCDVEQTVYGFDLDHANQILDEAGYVDTDGDGIREKDGVKLSAAFLYQTGTASDDNMVVYICDQASKIGIELIPQSAQMMDWYAMIQSGDYGLTIFKTQGGYYDPAMVITNINPSTSMDPILMQIGASQPELAALVDELDSATDEARIQEIYNTILTTMADQCLTTPLIYTRQLAIYSDAVASYTFPTDASFTSVQNIHLN